MTLAERIEGAREAIDEAENLNRFGYRPKEISQCHEKALTALPDQPMTELEMRHKICIKMDDECGFNDAHIHYAQMAIEALKAANALYVKEG